MTDKKDQEENHVVQVESPGAQLSLARESMGLSQQQVADNLRLRLQTIQALEKDELEPGISVTFSKGYVRLYARLVNLDVAPLLHAFSQIHGTQQAPARLQSFSRRVEREAHDSRWNKVTLIIVLFVIASLGFWWYDNHGQTSLEFLTEPQTNTAEQEQEQEPETTDEMQLQLVPNDAESQQQIEETYSGAIEDEVDTQTDVSSLSAIPSQGSRGDVSDPPPMQNLNEDPPVSASANTNQIQQIAANSPSDEVPMTFTFLEDCWLNVTDATSDAIAYGVKRQGYVMEISGVPPITVNLCPPSKVQITFDGERVDLTRYNPESSVVLQLPLARN